MMLLMREAEADQNNTTLRLSLKRRKERREGWLVVCVVLCSELFQYSLLVAVVVRDNVVDSTNDL